MKIAICIPSKDTVHVGFAKSLANLTSRLSKKNIDFELLINVGTVIPSQRNNLVKQALETKSNYILWLDSDMHFPSTVAETLISHDRDIVGCTYSTRIKPQRSVAFVDSSNLDARLTQVTGLHPVFAVGSGCMLVNIDVYKNLPKPWYQYIWNPQLDDLSGEDIYFCKLAKDFGYTTYVDADLSNSIAHFGTKAFIMQEVNESI